MFKLSANLLSLGLCFGFTAGAQTLDVKVQLPDTPESREMKVILYPANDPASSVDSELSRKEDSALFTGQIPANPDGIYYLYCQNTSFQTSVPVYVDPSQKSLDMEVSVEDFIPRTSLTDGVNSALSGYSRALAEKATDFAKNLPAMTSDEICEMVSGYTTDADSIAALAPLPAPVEQFMKIWAYTSTYDALSMASYLSSRRGRELKINVSSILPEAPTVLDNEMAATFPSTAAIVVASIPRGEIESRMASLYSRYTNPSILRRAAATIVGRWMDSYNYTVDFADGEHRLEALTEKYSLPENYLATYRARRATLKGTSFPEVQLVDRDGNSVDFGKFKGKYVYVDLWASWCGPCCKEVPHLQALEKEFEGSNVIFVSISTDTAVPQWHKKMNQLGMEGNQLLNSDGQLTEKLNVRGIPYFLIYDPEGNLYQANAPRPSSDEVKSLLASLR